MVEKKWRNNIISARMNDEFPRSFSICDVDGAVHVFYSGNKKRIIIYESKFKNEELTDSQTRMLYMLEEYFDFSKCDRYSGVYIFVGENANFDEISIYKIESKQQIFKAIISIKQLYGLFSNNDPFKL